MERFMYELVLALCCWEFEVGAEQRREFGGYAEADEDFTAWLAGWKAGLTDCTITLDPVEDWYKFGLYRLEVRTWEMPDPDEEHWLATVGYGAY